jgi:hypothetical protein
LSNWEQKHTRCELCCVVIPRNLLYKNPISIQCEIPFPFLQIPSSLYKEEGYDHRLAMFGTPTYGGSIAQNVYYTGEQDLCDGNVDTTKGVPTRPIDPFTGKMESWPSPYILMVDRGNCTFVTKVRTVL